MKRFFAYVMQSDLLIDDHAMKKNVLLFPFESISLLQGHALITIAAAVIPNDFIVTLATFVICQAKPIEYQNEKLLSYTQQH